nr:MAG TPA: zinc-ribbon containing domain protein [Caudoviricetes sp.]
MTENEAKEYMKNEVECIKRASHCNRECLKCELVKEEEPLLEAFDKAIQALEENQQYHAIGTVEELQALKEKAEPKKPNYEGDGYYNGELVLDTWICPNCGKSYEVDYDNYDYCPNCGQNIDHSGLTEDD